MKLDEAIADMKNKILQIMEDDIVVLQVPLDIVANRNFDIFFDVEGKLYLKTLHNGPRHIVKQGAKLTLQVLKP